MKNTVAQRYPLVLLILISMVVKAQRVDYSKMSPFVRRAAMESSEWQRCRRLGSADGKEPARGSICAFVRISGNADAVLEKTGSRKLAQFGNIYIADIPLDSISVLSACRGVERIEASQSNALALDTTSIIINAAKVYAADNLPQAYTGNGVVLGSMDVGYDLTHPNFYNSAMTGTRISRFWDQLSPDSIGSSLYVGADYRTEADILRYAHSFDASIETHGTHTLGIAAGTGYDTPYRGIAPDADLCLVSNVVNTDLPLIPEHLLYKYTSATDALGFKYIFDYAGEVGKPCVISFSEGSNDGFDGELESFYQVLASMTGEGRIFVASAGNCGYYNTYLHKPEGKNSDGVFLSSSGGSFYLSALGSAPFTFRLTAYEVDGGFDVSRVSRDFTTTSVIASADSLFVDTLSAFGEKVVYKVQAYKSTIQSNPVAYDVLIGDINGGSTHLKTSLEVVGSDADVQMFSNGVLFHKNEQLSMNISGGEAKYSVLSPSTSPDVICVGATSYRDHMTDKDGIVRRYDWGLNGELAGYSSVGPSRTGLTKPDVVAPGTLIISSMSSFFPQDNPTDHHVLKTCGYSYFNGVRYPWWAEMGTSMSAPVVAGTIALWLQANPRLTMEQIMQIFSETCHRRDGKMQGEKDNLYGYGEIDAYAGLLKVLGLDGIPGISRNTPVSLSLLVKPGKQLEFRATAGAEETTAIKVSVYSVSGNRLSEQSISLNSGCASLSLGHLPAGVYLIQTNSFSHKNLAGSMLIRLE